MLDILLSYLSQFRDFMARHLFFVQKENHMQIAALSEQEDRGDLRWEEQNKVTRC